MAFKRIYIALAMLIASSVVSSAQDSIVTRMTISGRPDQQTVIQLAFGIKKGATNGYDKELGEKSRFPQFPPCKAAILELLATSGRQWKESMFCQALFHHLV